ncbi:hypothetical protein EIN_094920 [Entamoeba invadens IP1]|uniref:Rho-GAP domain-containing protein n=1 Tax=Entamoeba invadens IP1 TaxID=370355 RepID=A0A0A1U036_ENTIV|nr:hypothetical protein EIN_094920 [Entamoeba invadens IP1]ELP87255.1 hypothetical protein EIN_094920 [Entamoeba invadens IP1]|eukprot:XP_004254026.1 hypothetical protein EIN_094920 [Entamoeba invadens IP1]
MASVLDTLKTKTERVVNAAANAVDKKECTESEYANSKLKALDDYENYIKKTKNFTNKILEAYTVVIDQLGNLSDLQQNFFSTRDTTQEQKDATTFETNFLLFVQGNFLILKEEVTKCVIKQSDTLLKEISDVKQTFTRNMRKPVDTLETMTVMKYQLDNIFELRNYIIRTQPYKIYNTFGNNFEEFYKTNSNVNDLIKKIADKEKVIPTLHLKNTLYVGQLLVEILDAECRNKDEVPKLVEQMINIVETKYVDYEGLFRTTGSVKMMNEIYHRMTVTNLDELGYDTITYMLKTFTRDLPGMLLSSSVSQDLLSVYKRSTDRVERIEYLTKLFANDNWMAKEKITYFKAICQMCHTISQNAEKNLMNEKNLAVCWTPTMFNVLTDDIGQYIEMLTFIIKESDFIFGKKECANDSKSMTTTTRPKNMCVSCQNETLSSSPRVALKMPKVPPQRDRMLKSQQSSLNTTNLTQPVNGGVKQNRQASPPTLPHRAPK